MESELLEERADKACWLVKFMSGKRRFGCGIDGSPQPSQSLGAFVRVESQMSDKCYFI